MSLSLVFGRFQWKILSVFKLRLSESRPLQDSSFAWLYFIISIYGFHEMERICFFSADGTKTATKREQKFCSIFCCNFQKNMHTTKNRGSACKKPPNTTKNVQGLLSKIPSPPNLYGIHFMMLYVRRQKREKSLKQVWVLPQSVSTLRSSLTACILPLVWLKTAQIIAIYNIYPIVS